MVVSGGSIRAAGKLICADFIRVSVSSRRIHYGAPFRGDLRNKVGLLTGNAILVDGLQFLKGPEASTLSLRGSVCARR
jgi:hypothetical protein